MIVNNIYTELIDKGKRLYYDTRRKRIYITEDREEILSNLNFIDIETREPSFQLVLNWGIMHPSKISNQIVNKLVEEGYKGNEFHQNWTAFELFCDERNLNSGRMESVYIWKSELQKPKETIEAFDELLNNLKNKLS
jgi:hypothetical protein